jgi:anti-sigma B factor antagonist
VPLLTLHGEHDLSNAELLRDGLTTVLAYGAAVVVDLSEATFVDSSVLHALLAASRPARDAPGPDVVVCVRADGFARRLLRMAGLHEVVRIAESLEDAVRSAAAAPAA